MQQRDVLFWLWLANALGAANRDFRKLILLYDSPYDLFHAEEEELERIPDLSPRTKKRLCDKNLQRASQILDTCERTNVGILTYGDLNYPISLRELPDPPVVLYYSGTLPDFRSRLFLGMVGTRSMSAYGLQQAYKIAYELASAGAVIVSGMAKGIDGVSAGAAIAAKGSTVAVLGCGVDMVYPSHHRPLQDEICRNGLLLSEYPPGAKPNQYHFPARNRLISGLSQGILVVEAGLRSGSLITAKNAILQGRDVFALPGNVGSAGARGTLGLIKDGATMNEESADILRQYQYVYAEQLRVERLEQASQNAKADLAYLDRLGIIKLINRSAPDAATPEAKEAKESSGRKPRQQAREDAPSCVKQKKQARVTVPQAEGDSAMENKNPVPASSPKPPAVEMESLTPIQMAVLSAIPDDHAISTDALCGLGYPYGETIAALTMLEILGLVQKLPGALYMKL